MSTFEITLTYDHKISSADKLAGILHNHQVAFDQRQLVRDFLKGLPITVHIDQRVLPEALVQLHCEGGFTITPGRFNDFITYHTRTRFVSTAYQVPGKGRELYLGLYGAISYKINPGHEVVFDNKARDAKVKVKQELECGIRSLLPQLEVRKIYYRFTIGDIDIRPESYMEEALFWAARQWVRNQLEFTAAPDPVAVFDETKNGFVFPSPGPFLR